MHVRAGADVMPNTAGRSLCGPRNLQLTLRLTFWSALLEQVGGPCRLRRSAKQAGWTKHRRVGPPAKLDGQNFLQAAKRSAVANGTCAVVLTGGDWWAENGRWFEVPVREESQAHQILYEGDLADATPERFSKAIWRLAPWSAQRGHKSM